MIKHLKIVKLIQIGVLLGASLMLLGPEIARILTSHFPDLADLWKHLEKFRVVIGTASLVILVLSLKWVWRPFWKIKGLNSVLSKVIAPDLNGDWDVKLESNFPVIEKLKKSAKGKRAFDVANADIKELIIADDAQSMTGHYWTNRQWQKGLNTAGKITFTKKR